MRYFWAEDTPNILIFTPSHNGPSEEQTLWLQQLHQHPCSPQTLHNQEHNTKGAHFTIFEMPVGPLWFFAVPSKHIRRGGRRERTIEMTIPHLSHRCHQIAAPHGAHRIRCSPFIRTVLATATRFNTL